MANRIPTPADPGLKTINNVPAPQPNAEKTPPTSPNKLLDAVDGLLLLSGSEDTMDGLESQYDNDNQIEFTQEVDMETLITALHIESANENSDHAHTSKTTRPKDSTEPSTRQRKSNSDKLQSTVNTPKTQQKDMTTTTTTPTSPKGNIRIRNVTFKRHKNNARNYYCQQCNDNVPYKGVHALNEHHRTKHNPVQCNVCNKWCSTPENLRRQQLHTFRQKVSVCNM